jgi:hypothetical protein
MVVIRRSTMMMSLSGLTARYLVVNDLIILGVVFGQAKVH